MNSRHGYLVVAGWDKFQHYKDRRPAWIKLHLDLLGNDAWLELSPADTKLLVTIWMLVGTYGQGRAIADPLWLQSQANLPLSNRYRGLERLVQAGFVSISASKMLAQSKSTNVLKKKEKESAREVAAVNGDHPRSEEDKPLSREERRQEAQAALALIAAQPTEDIRP